MNPNGVINEPIVHRATIAAKAVLSALGLVAYMALFKYIYDFELMEEQLNIRVWEDLYGRGLFFFLSSVVCYVYCSRHNDNISFFDLEPSMRWMFAARLVTGLLGYGFLALSIAEGQGLSTPILCLLVSGTVVRFYGALNNPFT
jgi:hypothetical protein